MVLPDREIWQAANVMVKQYGSSAAFEAAQRIDQLLDEGDLDGRDAWRRILTAIEFLLAERPDSTTH